MMEEYQHGIWTTLLNFYAGKLRYARRDDGRGPNSLLRANYNHFRLDGPCPEIEFWTGSYYLLAFTPTQIILAKREGDSWQELGRFQDSEQIMLFFGDNLDL